MVKKVVSYIFMILGAALLVLQLMFIETLAKIPFISELDKMFVLIIGGALILVGVLMLLKGRKKAPQQQTEVPIYHGKQVVGYRKQ